MSQTIPTGRYLGYNLVRLEAKLQTLQTAVEASGTGLIAATVNGQSFQFSEDAAAREGGNLAEQIAELQEALHWLAPHKYWAPGSNSSAVRLC